MAAHDGHPFRWGVFRADLQVAARHGTLVEISAGARLAIGAEERGILQQTLRGHHCCGTRVREASVDVAARGDASVGDHRHIDGAHRLGDRVPIGASDALKGAVRGGAHSAHTRRARERGRQRGRRAAPRVPASE